MVRLTPEQALAAAAQDRLVNIVSAPGSGKTTVAAERFGYQRHLAGDDRGVLGLSFNRAAVAELRARISARWGGGAIAAPHRVVTFDHLHVDLLHGDNGHHILEAVFKALARALAIAAGPHPRVRGQLSSKGVL